MTTPLSPQESTRVFRERFNADPELLKQYIPRGLDKPPGPDTFIKRLPTAKQFAFLLYNGMEGFFGGAGGGGKSEYMLMAAAQYVDCPNYKAVLVRRHWADFEQTEGMMTRMREWWEGSGPVYNEGKKRWRFPSGATIQLMHMEHEEDMYQLKGSAAHFIGYDEATEFTAPMILYAFRSLRKKKNDPIPLRLRLTSNPGGPGHDFCKKRYILPLPKGLECCLFPIVNPYDKTQSHECMTMLATAGDNPYLDQYYLQSMDNLPALERMRQKFGNWDAFAGGMFFDRDNFKVVKRIPCPVVGRGTAWDRAGSLSDKSDFTVGITGSLGEDGNLYVEDMIRGKWLSGDVDDIQLATAETNGVECSVYIQQDPAAAGKAEAERVVEHVLRSFNVEVETVATNVKGSKALRARPLASGSERGDVFFLEAAWNDDALNELSQFTEDGSHQHDDIVDTLALLYRKMKYPTAEVIETRICNFGDDMTEIEELLAEWQR